MRRLLVFFLLALALTLSASALTLSLAEPTQTAQVVASEAIIMKSTVDDTKMKFGMDAGSVDFLTSQGVKPDYGTFWVGPWNLQCPTGIDHSDDPMPSCDGWNWVDSDLEKMRKAGVTPVVQFFYWGDDISVECLENGCWSSLHNSWKSKQEWQKLAEELASHLNAKMHGGEVIIIVETEFNKESVVNYAPLDTYLEEKIKFFKQSYPNAKIVLGFGSWNPEGWKNFPRAASAADITGIQMMRGSTKDSLPVYLDAVRYTLDLVHKMKSYFGKPVMVTDVAFSSYPEPEYISHQETVLKQISTALPDFKSAGVIGIIYRSARDDPKFDTANYYGKAERHWGLAYPDGKWKPSFSTWTNTVNKERSP